MDRRVGIFATIVALSSLRWLWLMHGCALDLAPDEAHYWDWSRQLDASYYSKGPLIAWLIAASVELLGPWSLRQTGSLVLAVRAPAIACGALLLWGLWELSRQTLHSSRLAWAVVGIACSLPIVSAGSILMTIDAPFVALWTWALVVGHAFWIDRRRWTWPMLGVLVGLGLLTKYTMLLWLGSAALFLAARPYLLVQGAWRGTLGILTIAGLACLPMLWWNAAHDWIGLRHVAGQAGVEPHSQPTTIRWWGPCEYLGGQCALWLGFWFALWLAAIIRYRPGREPSVYLAYLWWMSLPTFVVFLLASVRKSGQVNWPVPAFLAGLPLLVALLADLFPRLSLAGQRWLRRAMVVSLGVGIGGTVLLHDSRPVLPWLSACCEAESETRPTPVRRLDPTCRLRGWKTLAETVQRLRDQVRQQRQQEAIVAADQWTIVSELAFYLPDQPRTYSLARAAAGRYSQYDLWHPNPIDEAQAFQGRSFVYVGEELPGWQHRFEQVQGPIRVTHREAGVAVASWKVWLLLGLRGDFADLVQIRPEY